jgi:hypothetical protein
MNRFTIGWEVKYQTKPDIEWAKDTALANGLADTHGLNEVLDGVDTYLSSADPYIVSAMHPFGLFVKHAGRHIATAKGLPTVTTTRATASNDGAAERFVRRRQG